MTQRVTEQMVDLLEDLRETLIQADMKIRSYPGADQSDVVFVREAIASIEAALSAAPASASVEIDRKRFEKAPCYLCGYNGPGYFQPMSHACASRYHAAEVDALFSPASASVAVKPTWQPIDTAPTESVGYFYSNVIVGFVTWGTEGRVHQHVGPIEWMNDHWEFIGIEFDVFPNPTHWASFPAPPALTTQPDTREAE